MNHVRPEKFVRCHGVYGDGDDEEGRLRCCYLATAVLNDEQKHPGYKNNSISVRELPAPGVSVTPEKERQDTDRDPAGGLVLSAFAEKEKKKWACKKD